MNPRTLARQAALQLLYRTDLTGQAPDPAEVERFFQASDPEVTRYACALLEGVIRSRAAIDGHLQEAAKHWRLERMTCIDRNVMRLAAFELLYREDVPPRVAINEAIELVKHYSTEKSGAFVNGLLDRIWHMQEAGSDGAASEGEAEAS